MPVFTLTVEVTDDSGLPLSDTALITINLNNVNEPPVLTVPGAQITRTNIPVTITGISVADQDDFGSPLLVSVSTIHGFITLATTAGLSFSTGDGTSDTTMTFTGTEAAINAALGSIIYQGVLGYSGPDTISITVNDQGFTGSGGPNVVSETIAVTIKKAKGIFVAEDPCHPGRQALFIFGTAKADRIKVIPAAGNNFTVKINNINKGTFGPITGRILVFGGAGNDRITINGTITHDTFLDGGSGNDIIKGGKGDDVILGGTGNDILTGGDGRDFIIGGVGADKLVGYKGTSSVGAVNDDDILIAGRTALDKNMDELCEVMHEWTANDPFAVRVANLDAMLNSLTVFKDTVDNQIAGGPGTDWIFTQKKANGSWR
jgi:Ca2+-binding RTX toxin-like protein